MRQHMQKSIQRKLSASLPGLTHIFDSSVHVIGNQVAGRDLVNFLLLQRVRKKSITPMAGTTHLHNNVVNTIKV
jgi:hypothetical protein